MPGTDRREDDAGRGQAQALKIIRIIDDHAQIIRSADGCFLEGQPFAVDEGTMLAVPVDSGAFTDMVTGWCTDEQHIAPQPPALKTAIATVRARVLTNDTMRRAMSVPIHVGSAVYEPVGSEGRRILIDTRDDTRVYSLFDGDWGEDNTSLHFYRPKSMKPLIEADDDVHDLTGLKVFSSMFPQVSPGDWPLVWGFIVMPWIYERGVSFPVMQIEGTAGSGKTTLKNTVLSLLSPETGGGGDLPSQGRDIAVTAMNHRVFSYDNVNTISRKQSDLLCRVSTGDSISQRALYTNSDEVQVSANAPVIITALNPGTEQSDLLDRSVIVRLHQFTRGGSVRGDLLKARFKREAPRIMASLLTLAARVARVIERKGADGVRLGRLTEYSTVLHAIDVVTGADPDVTATHGLDTYLGQRDEALIESASDDPLFVALQSLRGTGMFDPFDGRAADLYKTGTQLYGAVQTAALSGECSREAPHGAMGFSRRLTELSTTLVNSCGWQIEQRHSSDRKSHGVLLWHIQEPKPAADTDGTTGDTGKDAPETGARGHDLFDPFDSADDPAF